jgi:ribosome biogenesis GTPase A
MVKLYLWLDLTLKPKVSELRSRISNLYTEFAINEETVTIMTKNFTGGRLKIVSVIGMYRTGKSCLLNQLLLSDAITSS